MVNAEKNLMSVVPTATFSTSMREAKDMTGQIQDKIEAIVKHAFPDMREYPFRTEETYFIGPGGMSTIGWSETAARAISDASIDDIEDFFDLEAEAFDAMAEEEQSVLYNTMDRVDKVAESATYSIQNMNELEAAVADGGEYMVWHTAEDEVTCAFCGPLDNKIVNLDELTNLDAVPPAHVNCRCELVTIEEHYGELKPVKYYHSIPLDYDSWRETTKGEENLQTEIVQVDTPEE